MGTADRSHSAENMGNIAIPDYVVDDIARCLLPKLQAFFESEEGQQAFSEWKAQQKHTQE